MTTARTNVTHADGTVSTRGSKTRTYTHAIEVSPAPADRYAAYLLNAASTATAKAARFREAADAGRVQIVSRGFSTQDDHYSHQATLMGTDRVIYNWCSPDGQTKSGDEIVSVREQLIDNARQFADDYERTAAKRTEEAERVLAAGQPVGKYHVVRWSSSARLATAALGTFEYLAAQGHTVRVVPVDAA